MTECWKGQERESEDRSGVLSNLLGQKFWGAHWGSRLKEAEWESLQLDYTVVTTGKNFVEVQRLIHHHEARRNALRCHHL